MKIRITFDLDEHTRKAIGHRTGVRIATREQCRQIIEGLLSADIDVIVSDYEAAHSCENCGCWEHLPGPCDTCDCSAVEAP